MSQKKIYLLVGTRPNFIKITRFKALSKDAAISIIHTGQHFDDNMANVFFDQFQLKPDYFLEVGGLSPTSQIGQIILKLETLFIEIGNPDYLIVPGDVNSTLAGAIVANKMGIKLVHLESGLRSRDQLMPEEHNRTLTDYMSDICFVTEQSGLENLKEEKNLADIHFVGNTMIDTLVHFEPEIEKSAILKELAIDKGEYILTTFHRPSNVDAKQSLDKMVDLLSWLATYKKVVIPMHPRTLKMLEKFELLKTIKGNDSIIITKPLGYFEFQKLIKYSLVVITDSGGIQEETTYRQVPCLTVRKIQKDLLPLPKVQMC